MGVREHRPEPGRITEDEETEEWEYEEVEEEPKKVVPRPLPKSLTEQKPPPEIYIRDFFSFILYAMHVGCYLIAFYILIVYVWR